MKPEEAILMMRNRIDTASEIAGKGTDGKAFEDMEMAIEALKEIQQYREIGTVGECREAVEKQKPKKPLGGVDIAGNEYMICSYCSAIVEDGGWRADYCPDCGQAIKWDENSEGMEDVTSEM